MPLHKGSSKKVMSENFHELRHGKTYARTARKFGKNRARKQMIAIAMHEAGKSIPRKDKRGYY